MLLIACVYKELTQACGSRWWPGLVLPGTNSRILFDLILFTSSQESGVGEEVCTPVTGVPEQRRKAEALSFNSSAPYCLPHLILASCKLHYKGRWHSVSAEINNSSLAVGREVRVRCRINPGCMSEANREAINSVKLMKGYIGCGKWL